MLYGHWTIYKKIMLIEYVINNNIDIPIKQILHYLIPVNIARHVLYINIKFFSFSCVKMCTRIKRTLLENQVNGSTRILLVYDEKRENQSACCRYVN